jgi:hypothetical protein
MSPLAVVGTLDTCPRRHAVVPAEGYLTGSRDAEWADTGFRSAPTPRRPCRLPA